MNPPLAAEKLLPFLLPKSLREGFPGDLEEEYHVYRLKFGQRYADRWYWFQVLMLAAQSVGMCFAWAMKTLHSIRG
jgi:hypothetical protein